MALMTFREPNQVQWIGTRPAHRGTQVIARSSAENATVVVYTVAAGKILYLCTATLSVPVIAGGDYSLFVRDAGGVSIFAFAEARIELGTAAPIGVFTFWPPMELPAGYQIALYSSIAGLVVRGSVFGWVE